MNIGICALWTSRGQGVVARHLRSALDELGHTTHVLALPAPPEYRLDSEPQTQGVWSGPRITIASADEISADEYRRWAEAGELDACFFDENEQFAEVEVLRKLGVRTIGRFIWEHFEPRQVEPARRAFETIYAMSGAEKARYGSLGVEAPLLKWGIHPELADVPIERDPDRVTLHYHGGLLGRRKPYRRIIRAFKACDDPDLRLTFKAQVERHVGYLERVAGSDPRISLVLADLDTRQHLRLAAAADVCLAPARWEGLGLHLYEAIAFGQPIITNDGPPMNELVTDGVNGILVAARQTGTARSGIPAMTVDEDALRSAIERISDPGLRAELAVGAAAQRERLSWPRTIDSLAKLLA